MLITETHSYVDSARIFGLLADLPWAIYLDSGALDKQPGLARNANVDVLVFDPVATVVTHQGVTTTDWRTTGEMICENGDPLEVLKSVLARQFANTDFSLHDMAYLPGAYGYFSYDLARYFESFSTIATCSEDLPEMAVGIYTHLLLVDHQHHCVKIIADGEQALKRWRELIMHASEPTSSAKDKRFSTGNIEDLMPYDDYVKHFRTVRDYTIEGDCYQVNLSRQFRCRIKGNHWSLYETLRQLSPAPYGAFMRLPFASVLSNSPESFIKVRDRKVTTSPIKGTRPRIVGDPVADKAIARQLQGSAKDRAENLMIVDLMRNDLSRCCELGSVAVPELYALHSFANVHHLISTISGVLASDWHALDLLRSCFPGGSITGAPKIRAMQIIEELEPERRGLYCGAIGYIGVNSDMQTNIAIRTVTIKNDVARFAAGGGLVIDSQIDEEYEETNHKAKMMKQALSQTGNLPSINL